MTEKYSRAQRRADYARMKVKRQFHWGYGHKDEWACRMPAHAGEINYMPARNAGFVANTPTPCSCWMCQNPRHAGFNHKESVTMQELRAEASYEDQLDDLENWEDDYDYYYGFDDDWYGSWYDQIGLDTLYVKWKYCNQYTDEEYMWEKLKG